MKPATSLACAGYDVVRRQFDDRERDRRAGQEGGKGCGQRTEAVDADVPMVVEREHDQRDEERADQRKQISDALDAATERRERADQEPQNRCANQAPWRRLQNQREPGALHCIAHDRDPERKSPALVTNSVKLGHAIFGIDRACRCPCDQLC